MNEPTGDVNVHVHVHPSFGEYIDLEVTPDMLRGKLIWLTNRVRTVRKELADAQRGALEAKYALENASEAAMGQARAEGARSNADAERAARRATQAQRRAKDEADLKVTMLRAEADELYQAQLPATQSLNRSVVEERRAEWTTMGVQP